MNKLVIIGNGFDLAHGMETSYKDFVLWYINEKLVRGFKFKDPFMEQFSGNSAIQKQKSLSEFRNFISERNDLDMNFSNKFIRHLIDKASLNNWVDIENEYFKMLIFQLNSYLKSNINVVDDPEIGNIIDLNNALDSIKVELSEYLNGLPIPVSNGSIQNILYSLAEKDRSDETLFLNFNYTSTIQLYRSIFPQELNVIHIHGKLKDNENPIIFGYGDESNDYFEKIEKMNNNELTRHLKSFAYLQTANYRRLFEFLDKENFEVYVMGHSLGLSDRLLFNHIFEHPHFRKVQLYYYEYEKDGVVVNDFFQKTQELSRHFKLDAKHKMRKCVVPFNESKPLTIYKP